MATIITLLIVLLAVGGALTYIIKSKKRGVKCIGCSEAGSCTSCSSEKHMEEEMRKYIEEQNASGK